MPIVDYKLKYYEACEHARHFNLVKEFCGRQDLEKRLNAAHDRMEELERRLNEAETALGCVAVLTDRVDKIADYLKNKKTSGGT